MGSQQLLLLVIAFIVVLLMAFAGVSMFESYAQSSNRDLLLSTINLAANQAQVYYKKPADTGGGGNSFNGFTLPDNLLSAEYGQIRVRVRNNRINFVGTGIEKGNDGVNVVRVRSVVTPNQVTVTVVN